MSATTTDDEDDDGEIKHLSVRCGAAITIGKPIPLNLTKAKTKPKKKRAPHVDAVQQMDVRRVFPIDEKDQATREVMGALSYYMRTLNRTLGIEEQMGYLYAWFTVTHSLNRLNSSEYATVNMKYANGHVSTGCFRFEIVTRLHQACYESLQHAIDHIYSMLHAQGVHPMVLLQPVTHITPMEFETLLLVLRALVEYCQIALKLVHKPWIDFPTAWPKNATENHVARVSPAHTATLGVLCSHMLQVMGTLKKGSEELKDTYFKWLWQSAAVINEAQGVLPQPESHSLRVNLTRLSAQLQIVVFRAYMDSAGKGYDFAKAAFFAEKILGVLGGGNNTPDGQPDPEVVWLQESLAVYYHECKRTGLATLAFNDAAPLASLTKHVSEMHLSRVAVQTMATHVVSVVGQLRLQPQHRLITEFQDLRLRYRSGRIAVLEPLSIQELLLK